MSRRSTTNVSLFPFLAVLVCAMGALILLLLVTTRQIRSNQLASLNTDVATTAEPPPPPETIAPPPAPIEPEVPDPPFVPQPGPDIVRTLPPDVTDHVRDEDHAERDAAALRRYSQELKSQLEQLSEQQDQLIARLAALDSAKADYEQTRSQLETQLASIGSQERDLTETQRRLDGQLDALRRALAAAEAEPVKAVSKYRLIPFDGARGTVRRPIMIECRGETLRFLPEGIELTKTELDGFLSGLNPLLSGAAALSAYWHSRDRGADIGDPYVLLVVRPSGSLGFYAAKRLLAKLNAPIGYELLGEHQELDLPEADAGAVRALRLAVQRTLARRAEIAALRPLTEPYLARQRGTAGSGSSAFPESDQQPAGRHQEAFRRLMAGVRTQNAPRPERMPSVPSYTPRPRPRGRLGHFPDRSDSAPKAEPPGSGTEPGEPGALPWIGSGQPDGATAGRSGIGSKLAQLPDFNNTGRPGRAGTTEPTASDRGLPPPDPSAEQLGVWPPGTSTAARADEHRAGTTQPPSTVTDGSTKPLASAAGGVGTADSPGQRHGATGNQAGSGQGPAGVLNMQQRVITFRRAVDLFVDPDSVVVGNNPPIRVDQTDSSGPWLGAVMLRIEAEVRSWGPAPKGMQWGPEVRFRISPGANRTYTRLRNALTRLGMRSTEEFTLGPRVQNSSDAFRSASHRRTGVPR